MEGDVKDAIRKCGGSINHSGLFLSTTSKETVINRNTGINRRSVAFIPRIKISDDILQMLDQMCTKSQADDNTILIEDVTHVSTPISLSQVTHSNTELEPSAKMFVPIRKRKSIVLRHPYAS
uniref:Uncharacterized protein n=1 Tax=Amphimedon queenslandica TaxID=400682 RepID=A0A1X7TUH1_AMPQE